MIVIADSLSCRRGSLICHPERGEGSEVRLPDGGVYKEVDPSVAPLPQDDRRRRTTSE